MVTLCIVYFGDDGALSYLNMTNLEMAFVINVSYIFYIYSINWILTSVATITQVTELGKVTGNNRLRFQ